MMYIKANFKVNCNYLNQTFSFYKFKLMNLNLSMRNYKIFRNFLKFSLKNNEKQYYMQPNAKYFCLFFSNNFKKL